MDFVTYFVGRSRYGPLIYPGLALANDGLQDDKAEKYLNFTADFLRNHGALTSVRS